MKVFACEKFSYITADKTLLGLSFDADDATKFADADNEAWHRTRNVEWNGHREGYVTGFNGMYLIREFELGDAPEVTPEPQPSQMGGTLADLETILFLQARIRLAKEVLESWSRTYGRGHILIQDVTGALEHEDPASQLEGVLP